MHPRKFSDDEVRSVYEYAEQTRTSVLQACRAKGLTTNDYAIIRTWGKKLGLKALTPAEVTGHAERDSQLYVLIVHGEETGIYVGSSADPNLRLKQHITKAKRDGSNGINKRDRFMFEAMQVREDFFTFKVFPKKYKASEIAPFETALIKKMKDAFPDLVFLNGLIGAPMGGYGIKLSSEQEQSIIEDYSNERITTEKLAEKYGVGRGTINRILQREGATKTRAEMMVRYDDDVRQKVIEEIKLGATDGQITEKYGMSKATIGSIKRKNGMIKHRKAKPESVEVQGQRFSTLKDAANHYGVDYKNAYARLKVRGWTLEEALEIKPRITKYNRPSSSVTAFGVKYDSMAHAARAFDLSPKLVSSRVRTGGWPLEKALTTKAGDASHVGLNPAAETQKRMEQVRELGYASLAEASRAYGIGNGTVSRRLAKGFSLKEALETPLMSASEVRWGKKS